MQSNVKLQTWSNVKMRILLENFFEAKVIGTWWFLVLHIIKSDSNIDFTASWIRMTALSHKKQYLCFKVSSLWILQTCVLLFTCSSLYSLQLLVIVFMPFPPFLKTSYQCFTAIVLISLNFLSMLSCSSPYFSQLLVSVYLLLPIYPVMSYMCPCASSYSPQLIMAHFEEEGVYCFC